MGSEVERKKLWAFGKNTSTILAWEFYVGIAAGELRRRGQPIPKAIPDEAVFREDFSFEWIEVTLLMHPDTPEMEVLAWAAK